MGRVTAPPASLQASISVEVATVGDRLEFVDFEHFLGLLRHPSKLPTVVADVYDLVRNNQMVIGFYGDLHVVANNLWPSNGHPDR